MRLRVKFTKTGCLKYIGHLDVMRYFQKALRRADFPVALSEGFSPHMVMSFAQPLGVGKTSGGEYFDVDLSRDMDPAAFADRLNAQMVEWIRVVHAVEVPDGKKYKGMTMVAAARYLVSLRQGTAFFDGAGASVASAAGLPAAGEEDVFATHEEIYAASAAMEEAVSRFLDQPVISVLKETKKGTAETDIRPLIERMEAVPLPEEMQLAHPSGAEAEPVAFRMTVCAKSGANLKPELLMRAFADFSGRSFKDTDLLIHREDTLADIGEEEHPVYVPLDDARAFAGAGEDGRYGFRYEF